MQIGEGGGVGWFWGKDGQKYLRRHRTAAHIREQIFIERRVAGGGRVYAPYSAVGVSVSANVTASNTVTVSVCALLAVTPAAKTYNVRVLQ